MTNPAVVDPAIEAVARHLWGQSAPHLTGGWISRTWTWMSPAQRERWLKEATLVDAARG